MTMRRRVVKLGGSLLDFDGLAPRFREWLCAQPPMQTVMIVGGGAMADVIRDAFARHAIEEEAAHWLCIRILGVTAELVSRLLPESMLVKRFEEIDRPEYSGRLVIFEPEQFLRDEARIVEPFGLETLPHCWDVTSDSIAARLALVLRAEELVLLKSSLPAQSRTLCELANAGYIDRYFPIAANSFPLVRFVNLREGREPQRHEDTKHKKDGPTPSEL